MCVKPFTPEYDRCLEQLAAHTQTIAAGSAAASTWLYRGGCLQNLRDLPGAIRDYDYALSRLAELTPQQQAQTYASRGACRRQLDDKHGSVADGERAVLLDPRVAHYFTDLGMARFWAGQYVEALADLEQALALDADEAWAIAYLGLCRQRLGDHAAAIVDFTTMTELADRVAHKIYFHRAASRMCLDQFEMALADCDTAARLAVSEDPNVYLLRAYCYLRVGNFGPALGDLSRAISLRPGRGEPHLWRGLAYRALGDEQAAIADLTEFAQNHPAGPVAALRESAAALDLVAGQALALGFLSDVTLQVD